MMNFESVGELPTSVGIVNDIPEPTLHRARLAVAHFATDAADLRLCLEALGFLAYPTNRLSVGHKL